MASKSDQLIRALRLTEQMERAARDAQWERLEVLESERRPLLRDCFPLDDPGLDPATALKRVRRMVELDRAVMGRIAAARDEAAEALGRIGQGRTATQAYEQVGR